MANDISNACIQPGIITIAAGVGRTGERPMPRGVALTGHVPAAWIPFVSCGGAKDQIGRLGIISNHRSHPISLAEGGISVHRTYPDAIVTGIHYICQRQLFYITEAIDLLRPALGAG